MSIPVTLNVIADGMCRSGSESWALWVFARVRMSSCTSIPMRLPRMRLWLRDTYEDSYTRNPDRPFEIAVLPVTTARADTSYLNPSQVFSANTLPATYAPYAERSNHRPMPVLARNTLSMIRAPYVHSSLAPLASPYPGYSFVS